MEGVRRAARAVPPVSADGVDRHARAVSAPIWKFRSPRCGRISRSGDQIRFTLVHRTPQSGRRQGDARTAAAAPETASRGAAAKPAAVRDRRPARPAARPAPTTAARPAAVGRGERDRAAGARARPPLRRPAAARRVQPPSRKRRCRRPRQQKPSPAEGQSRLHAHRAPRSAGRLGAVPSGHARQAWLRNHLSDALVSRGHPPALARPLHVPYAWRRPGRTCSARARRASTNRSAASRHRVRLERRCARTQQVIEPAPDFRRRRPERDEEESAPAPVAGGASVPAAACACRRRRVPRASPARSKAPLRTNRLPFCCAGIPLIRERLALRTADPERRDALLALAERLNPASWTDADQITAGLQQAAEALERLSRVMTRRRRRRGALAIHEATAGNLAWLRDGAARAAPPDPSPPES